MGNLTSFGDWLQRSCRKGEGKQVGNGSYRYKFYNYSGFNHNN
jgi:hypothetical protein